MPFNRRWDRRIRADRGQAFRPAIIGSWGKARPHKLFDPQTIEWFGAQGEAFALDHLRELFGRLKFRLPKYKDCINRRTFERFLSEISIIANPASQAIPSESTFSAHLQVALS